MPNIKPGPWNQINARPLTQNLFRTTFSRAIAANGVDPTWFRQIGPLGAGIGYSQTGGNLVLTSGVTANSELILRSTQSFAGDIEMRWQSILSQRIVNQSFVVELVDVVGDELAILVNSATSATITFRPGENPFTAANVGQSINMGAFNGVAGIPGRYAIASVSGDTVTFTVSGFPASGNGTCSLFGWNFIRCVYSGTTATSMNFDTQRNGYNSGDTAATINTTASPGHMGIAQVSSGSSTLLDQLVASATGLQTAVRANRVVNLPTEEQNLFFQLRIVNGSTAPASTTTWTVGMVAVYDFRTANVTINDTRPTGVSSPLPMQVSGGTLPAVTTVTTVTTVSALTGGGAAEDAAAGANPVTVGGVVRTAVAPTTLVAGDAARATMTAGAAMVMHPYSVPEASWQTPAIVGGLVNTTTSLQLREAPGALLCTYVTAIDLYSEALTNATDLRIREPDLTCASQTIASNTLTTSATHNLRVGDAVVFTASTVTGITAGVTYYVLTTPAGTTLTLSATRGGSTLTISGTGVTATFHKVLWMTRIPTTGAAPRQLMFRVPLRGSVNTNLLVQTATASGAGAVYLSAQGFIAQ